MDRSHLSRPGIFAVLLLVAAGGVAGCGMQIEPPQPKYEINYSYVPPATDTGRMCAAHCLTSKDQCQTVRQLSTDLAKERCENDAREQARRDHASYAKEREKKGKKVERTEASFLSRHKCEHAGATQTDCNQTYHQCYSTCGGQVTAQSICVANCDVAAGAPVAASAPPAPPTTGAVH